MASDLATVKQAIEAELSLAKQGAAYYNSRVKALENALHQIESVEQEKPKKAKFPTTEKEVKIKLSKRGRKPRAGAAGATGASGAANGGGGRQQRSSAKDLPVTGGDFWYDLVNNQPQSAVDIANAAVTALGIKPDQKKHIQKLKQRVSPALAGLVSSRKIKDTGIGRDRRFFRSEAA